MADISFKITSGPYENRYDIELGHFTATEMVTFREAMKRSLTSVFKHAPEDGLALEDCVGMAWLLIRRRTKGLPYQVVLDSVTYDNFEYILDDDEQEPELKVGDEIPPEG